MVSDRTVSPVGRPRGQPKTGGLQKGGVKLRTAAVKLAVLTVFEKVNESDEYLTDIAENDPKLFLSLLARLIPTESNATVDLTQHHVIDLGAAMREANEHLARMVNRASARRADAGHRPAGHNRN